MATVMSSLAKALVAATTNAALATPVIKRFKRFMKFSHIGVFFCEASQKPRDAPAFVAKPAREGYRGCFARARCASDRP